MSGKLYIFQLTVAESIHFSF